MKSQKWYLVAIISTAVLVVSAFLGSRYIFPHKFSVDMSQNVVIIDMDKQEVVKTSNIELKGELTYSWFLALTKYQGTLVIGDIPLTYDSSYSLDIAHFVGDHAFLNYSASLAPQDNVTLGVLKCSPNFERFSIRFAQQDGASSNYYLVPLGENSSYADAMLILKSMWPTETSAAK